MMMLTNTGDVNLLLLILISSTATGANLTLRTQALSAVSGRSFWLSCGFLSRPLRFVFLKKVGEGHVGVFDYRKNPCKAQQNPFHSNLPILQRISFTCNDTASTMAINPVHLSEDGTTWSCSGQSLNSNPYIMDVQVPVSAVAITSSAVVSSHGRISLIEGQPSKLQCTANDSKPVAQITWFRLKTDGHKEQLSGVQTNITSPNKLSDVISTLSLTPRRSDDGAVVYCRASNMAGEPAVFSRHIILDVSCAEKYSIQSSKILAGATVGAFFAGVFVTLIVVICVHRQQRQRIRGEDGKQKTRVKDNQDDAAVYDSLDRATTEPPSSPGLYQELCINSHDHFSHHQRSDM